MVRSRVYIFPNHYCSVFLHGGSIYWGIFTVESCTGIHSWASADGIGIPASYISVRFRSISVPEWILLSRYRTIGKLEWLES